MASAVKSPEQTQSNGREATDSTGLGVGKAYTGPALQPERSTVTATTLHQFNAMGRPLMSVGPDFSLYSSSAF